MCKNPSALWLAPIFFLSGIAAAQPFAQASVAPAAITASSLPYRSAFDGYKPYTDDKLLNWKGANDTAGHIGGWRAYAKEARQLDTSASAHDMSQLPEAKPEGGKP